MRPKGAEQGDKGALFSYVKLGLFHAWQDDHRGGCEDRQRENEIMMTM